MIEIGAVPAAVQALLIVIAVLIEAVILYVGYGYLEDMIGPRFIDTIENL